VIKQNYEINLILDFVIPNLPANGNEELYSQKVNGKKIQSFRCFITLACRQAGSAGQGLLTLSILGTLNFL